MHSSREIPVIDFADFLSLDTQRMRGCANKIREACLNDGFFHLVNHGVPRELQKHMIDNARQFFALPLEEKMKLDKTQNSYNRGYEVMCGQQVDADTQPDLKEGYYVGPDIPMHHPKAQAGRFAHGPNLWPQTLGQPFQDSCMAYLNHMIALAEKVMQAIALSLDLPGDYFDEFCNEPLCFYKIQHYPSQPVGSTSSQRGIGSHRDFGIITLLLQGEIPGLEVWDRKAGEWYLVPPLEGAYVVNVGNLLEQWTNDIYFSAVHRVTNRTGQDRYSIPFNYNGNPDQVVSCIETCKAQGEKYEPVSVEDYIIPKYEIAYGRAGAYRSEVYTGARGMQKVDVAA